MAAQDYAVVDPTGAIVQVIYYDPSAASWPVPAACQLIPTGGVQSDQLQSWDGKQFVLKPPPPPARILPPAPEPLTADHLAALLVQKGLITPTDVTAAQAMAGHPAKLS